MSRFTKRYEYHIRFGHPRHIWIVVGARIAVHLWIDDMNKEGDHYPRYSGGIELHHRAPPHYMKDDAPAQPHCDILDGPCWHDGSSLQAEEHWIPMWKAMPHDHDAMLAALERELIIRDGSYADEEESDGRSGKD